VRSAAAIILFHCLVMSHHFSVRNKTDALCCCLYTVWWCGCNCVLWQQLCSLINDHINCIHLVLVIVAAVLTILIKKQSEAFILPTMK